MHATFLRTCLSAHRESCECMTGLLSRKIPIWIETVRFNGGSFGLRSHTWNQDKLNSI